MPTQTAILIFLGSLILGTSASAVLSHRVDQLGTRLGLSEGLLGLMTALAADSPEIASAVTALANGQRDLGNSVIFGSNIFNIAALLGLGAVIAGGVICGRATLILNAVTALWVTGVVAAQSFLGIAPIFAGLLILFVFLPYIIVSALKPLQLLWLRVPRPLARWFDEAVSGTEVDTGDNPHPTPPSWADMVSIVPLLAMIVIASIAMVRMATTLGHRWELSNVVIGALLLATLTGIPNVVAAIRLALQGRGAAIVSETFNSNTLNLIAAAYLPTLFVTPVAVSANARLSLWWLVGITLAASVLLVRSGKLGRLGGIFLITAYAVFAVMTILG